MIQKYRNEFIILTSLIVLILSMMYKHYSLNRLENQIDSTKKAIQEIEEAKRLKNLWYARGMKSKLSRLRRKVPKNKIKRFNESRKKLDVVLKKLESRELNEFMNELSKLPLRISRLKIRKVSTNQYDMECLCKW